MSNKTRDELQLAKDHCLFYKGPVAFYGVLTLTNKQLSYAPLRKVDRLAGIKKFSIEITHIENAIIEGFEKTLKIKTQERTYRFSGRGARRIFERLDIQLRSIKGEHLNLTDIDMLNERVLLQGDLDVYLKGRLHTSGQVILTIQRLRIESLPSLETMLFSQKSLNVSIDEIRNFSYEPISRRLLIETKTEQIAVGGKSIPSLFLYMESIKDGSFNGNRPIVQATFFHGQMFIHGLLFDTARRLLFCPLGRLDSLAGANALSVSLNKISQIEITGWPEQRLKFNLLKNKSLFFGVKDPIETLNSLISAMCSFPEVSKFKDLRDGKTNSHKTRRKLTKIGVNLKSEEVQLIEWTVRVISSDAIQMGWLLLTNEFCRFISIDQGVVWSSMVKDLNRAKNAREHDPIVRLNTSEGKQTFVPKGGSQFNKLFWAMVTGTKPEQEGKVGRAGQSIRRVIGRFRYLNIFRNEVLCMSLNDVVVLKKPQGLRIEVQRMITSPFSVGDVLMVEVPRNEGRFRYFSVVCENYVSEPDPIGRFYVTLEKPTDVIVFNQRTSFRITYSQKTLICVFVTDPEKNPGDFRLLKEIKLKNDNKSPIEILNSLDSATEVNEPSEEEGEEGNNDAQINGFESDDGLNSIGVRQCDFFDISLGGCSFSLKEDLSVSLAHKTEKLIFKLIIPFESGDLQILTRLVNVRENVERNAEFIHGCQFFNVNSFTSQRLKREVMRLEREQVRELILMEDGKRKLTNT